MTADRQSASDTASGHKKENRGYQALGFRRIHYFFIVLLFGELLVDSVYQLICVDAVHHCSLLD